RSATARKTEESPASAMRAFAQTAQQAKMSCFFFSKSETRVSNPVRRACRTVMASWESTRHPRIIYPAAHEQRDRSTWLHDSRVDQVSRRQLRHQRQEAFSRGLAQGASREAAIREQGGVVSGRTCRGVVQRLRRAPQGR